MNEKQDIESVKKLLGGDFFSGIKDRIIEKLLEKYYIIQILGAGGNASVVEAKRLSDHHNVAVKILRCYSLEKKTRFKEEIRILREWNGKITGLMPIFDSNEDENGFWYEMPIAELAESRLCELSVKNRVETAVEIVRACAITMKKLHTHGISHRDIKPDNIYCLNNEFIIGDLGLVDVPESKELTHSDKALGAIFTMAPEMRRNPQVADGKKADVYSLAKTLWMFIKNDKYGFDGPYDWADEKIGMHLLSSPEQKLHLSELELLMHDSTDNDPDRRPTMERFADVLDLWVETEKDAFKVQMSEWNFLKLNIFGRYVPNIASFTDFDTILRVLRMICFTPAWNHTLFSSCGGLDLIGVEKSAEEDNITLMFDLDTVVLRPKVLQVGIFEESELNYFLLDAEQQSPIPDIEESDGAQHLVEDKPGHYVSAIDAVYGVYDYDEGNPFPVGWHRVTRLSRGRLLIVSKSGPYNSISAVYDGRHADCSMHVFHKYMEKIARMIKEIRSEGLNWRDYDLSKLCGLGKNPFKNDINENTSSILKPPPPSDFLIKKVLKQNFLKAIPEPYHDNTTHGNYSFALKPNHFFSGVKNKLNGYKLCTDGRLYEEQLMPAKMFTTIKLSDARYLATLLQKEYDVYCDPYNRRDSEIDFGFDICIENISNKQLKVSPKDIVYKATMANDREFNRFVVDEDGLLVVLTGDEARTARWYPVRMEMFEPRTKNVGKYSEWSQRRAESYYNAIRGAWLSYCKAKQFFYCDYGFM